MRPAPALVAITLLTLTMVGCGEPRQPIVRATAVNAADDYQRLEGCGWADPIDVLAPDVPAAQGRSWWQVRYPDGPEGRLRIILVDGATGWARLPPADYRVRVSNPVLPTAAPLTMLREGTAILVVVEPAPAEPALVGTLERECARLNALASRSNRWPAFAAKRDAQGRIALVYGWQGDRGTVQDNAISDWLAAHTDYGPGRWVDLSK